MSDLLNELIADVKADRMQQAWSRHGKWVIYAAVSIVLVTAAVVYWNHHARSVAMRDTAQYFEAQELLDKGEASAALSLFEKISPASHSPFTGLIMLKKAQANSMLGKEAEATALYAELAKRNDVYGDLGKIHVNEPKLGDATPLQYSRMEWAAWDSVSKGDNTKAAEQFQLLAKNETAPATLRDRAGMMATYLKSKGGAQ